MLSVGDEMPTKAKTTSTEVTVENLDDFLAKGSLEPIHPGIMYRRLIIERKGRTVTEIAERAGISRELLHRILRGEASITANNAIGLAEAINADPEFWMRAQVIFDLWQARKRREKRVQSTTM